MDQAPMASAVRAQPRLRDRHPSGNASRRSA
ncbi:hypothetical protein J2853_005004 [Streptosporangium lutulentum]|uniref:Uncharacterized protein n=1 Tax=Streptosporangium lutulentum TaxID=1461250 RepID=A0ABT9QHL2_9ACTN|nr:hypothetical protein [Streptosporangium lutulentum]